MPCGDTGRCASINLQAYASASMSLLLPQLSPRGRRSKGKALTDERAILTTVDTEAIVQPLNSDRSSAIQASDDQRRRSSPQAIRCVWGQRLRWRRESCGLDREPVYQHWLAFKSEKPVEWLSEGAAPSLEQTWEFVRDGLANVREDSLAVRGEPPCSRETLLGYVISMRDSVWPELFPSMCRGEFAMSVGEWRQFWASLFKRVADLFDQSIQGAQVVLGQTVQQNSTAAALARGLEPAAAAEEGLQARRDAVKLVWGHWLQFQLLRGADRRALVSV